MGCFMRIGTLVLAFPVSFTLSLNSANRKEQPMKPFARINLSSVALRRGILVSSLAREGKYLATKNTKETKKGIEQ